MNQKCAICGGQVMTDGRVAHLQDCPARQLMNTANWEATDRAVMWEEAFCKKLKKILLEALEEHERDKRRDT
jgi:hypothetical protein